MGEASIWRSGVEAVRMGEALSQGFGLGKWEMGWACEGQGMGLGAVLTTDPPSKPVSEIMDSLAPVKDPIAFS